MENNNTGFIAPDTVYHENYGHAGFSKLKNKLIRKDVSDTHLCVLASLVLSLTISFVLSLVLSTVAPYMMMTTGIPRYLYFIVNMFGSAFTIGAPFFVYLAFRKESVSEYLRFRKNSVFDSVLLVLAAVSCCMLANYPAMFIMELVEGAGMNGGAQENIAGTNAFESVLYFLSMAVFPPIFEEFAFRGVMLSSLRKHGDGFALVVSSLAFALVHISISSMPFALICGFTLGYVYLRTENLWLCIIIHFINNANSALPGILYLYIPQYSVNIFLNIIFYALILAGIAALIILIVRRKLSYKADDSVKRCISFDLPFIKKLFAYLSSPGALIMLFVTLGMIVLSMFGLY